MKLQVILDNGDLLNIPQEGLTLVFQADGLSASLFANIPPAQVALAQFTFEGGRYVRTTPRDGDMPVIEPPRYCRESD